MELMKADIRFSVNKKKVKFSIIHNLPDVFGLSINGALDNWLVRTNKFTARSFVRYINSKGTGYIAMTEKQYNRLCKYGS